jgi:ethanolamine phosphate transferase 2 subunit G
VTRHVPEELENGDWNAMIMHYLGLDHIGHKTGPQGPNMLPKQREMDGIVKTIYEAMETKDHHADTLLVLLGDHGMNAGGNHGGSGPGETEPALLFASPKLKARRNRNDYQCPTTPKDGTEFHYYRKVEQSDIVPTLAGLMQLPVSKNSLGVFIEEFANCFSATGAVHLLHQNGVQMKKILEAAYGDEYLRGLIAKHKQDCLKGDGDGPSCHPDSAERELAAMWAAVEHSLDAFETHDDTALASLMLRFLGTAQETLSNAACSYDVPKMVAGIGISALALSLAIISMPRLWPPSTSGIFFALTSVFYGIMMFASSYVEEEQHFWYWLTPAWTVLLTVRSVIRFQDKKARTNLAIAGFIILAVHRVVVRWNQTGQKHAGAPDIVHNFFPNQHILMWLLILVTHGYLCFMLVQRTFRDLVALEVAVGIATVLIVPAIVFKLNFTQADAPELVQGLAEQLREWSAPFSLVQQALFTFLLLALATIGVAVMAIGLAKNTELARPGGPAVQVTLAERFHYPLTLFLMMQSRAPNIPLFLGLELQRRALQRLLRQPFDGQEKRHARISPSELATSVLLLSHAYFFCFGGSNSISSVDLSNAYNGVGDYNIIAVGVLLFASNWTGPIWWCSAAVQLTFSQLSKLQVPPKVESKRQWIEAEREKLRKDALAASSSVKEAEVAFSEKHWLGYVSCMTAFVAASLVAVMAACTALRTHLFIWTVFSPKFLYAMAWCIGWHLLINIGMGSLWRWLGQIA